MDTQLKNSAGAHLRSPFENFPTRLPASPMKGVMGSCEWHLLSFSHSLTRRPHEGVCEGVMAKWACY